MQNETEMYRNMKYYLVVYLHLAHVCNRKVCLCLGHLWDWILCLVSYSVIMYYSLQLLSTTSGKIQPEFGHHRHPRGLQENWISSHMWEIFFFFLVFFFGKWEIITNYQQSSDLPIAIDVNGSWSNCHICSVTIHLLYLVTISPESSSVIVSVNCYETKLCCNVL